MQFTPADFSMQIDSILLRDRHRARRTLRGIEHALREGRDARGMIERLAAGIERSRELLTRRKQNRPMPTYPQELPVAQRKDEIARAIAANQVLVLAGETGSGKTTQLPKICLELGRGIAGMIGHTQPRRIAARSVAQRIADELGTGLGEAVGYQVRFTDTSSENTLVKLMTDGILLT